MWISAIWWKYNEISTAFQCHFKGFCVLHLHLNVYSARKLISLVIVYLVGTTTFVSTSFEMLSQNLGKYAFIN